ncbi:hypothetical protein [Aggregatilinea lenta]|uniref:hypothetical protein n=1 Tax=Aggregatilinea lenta TaxID=913108 RepID=UPI000E5A92AD|nr:hypothetical protein [Aggregatilinea lenta]
MKRLLSMILLAALVISPVAVFAQTEEPMEWEQYTSEDGSLSLSYPSGWIAQNGGDDIPFPSAVVVNSEDTLSAWNDPAAEGPGPGQVAILTIILPRDFFDTIGMTLEEDASLADLAATFAQLFGTDEEAVEAEAEMLATEEAMAEPVGTEAAMSESEAEEIDLGDGMMAGYVEVSESTGDTAYVARDLGDGLVSVTIAFTASGELSDEFVADAQQIAASISYSGTADALMESMMGPTMSGTADAGEASLSGEELVQERCTVCHDLARVDAQDKDEAGWTATVDRMIGYGAQLNAGERQAVIDYLVETH